MKYSFLIICLILVHCSKPKETSNSSNIFNANMLREINKLIEKKKANDFYDKAVCYILLNNSINDRNGDNYCYVYMSLDFGLDTAKISGYTWINSEFIVCYIINDMCNNDLIHTNSLNKDKGVIRKYFYMNFPMPEGNYDYPQSWYKIVNNDSLVSIDPIKY